MADAADQGSAPLPLRTDLQGVVRSYDPVTGDGTLLCDGDLREYELSRNALDHSLFRMLRQGQRVVFDLDERDLVVDLRVGSEADMGTPGFPAGQTDPLA